MTLATERDRISNLFDRIERIEEVAQSMNPGDERRTTLLDVAREALADCEPIRPGVAADLLHLSEPTIRSWINQGVLARADINSPRVQLDPLRLHDVLHFVHDLRRAGQTKGLLKEVWHRLQDQALSERDDLRESLQQMRGSIGREIDPDDVRPHAEKLA